MGPGNGHANTLLSSLSQTIKSLCITIQHSRHDNSPSQLTDNSHDCHSQKKFNLAHSSTVFLELIVNILQIKDQDSPAANGPNGKTG